MRGRYGVVIMCLLHLARPQASSGDRCFCQLSGKVEDCCCDIETVDSLNKEIYPRITEIVKRNYFKFFKINLNRPCPFWPDDGSCSLKDCSVKPCTEDEVPQGLKGGKQPAAGAVHKKRIKSTANNVKGQGEKAEHSQPQEAQKKCKSENGDNATLGNVDNTISDADKQAFVAWQSHDEYEDNFCELDDESSSDTEYMDLLRNPERFTGYVGASPRRIWNSIYRENCFRPQAPYGKSYITSRNLESLCLEKRVFFRVMSGMHASVNIHLSAIYYYKGNAFVKPRWGFNFDEFKRRFDPETTHGEGPVWLKNLYFAYTLVLRAVQKAAPYWEQEDFYTGEFEEDEHVKRLISDLLEKIKTCPSTFDEKVMFSGDPETASSLKLEFRQHFRNISKIMDCVGCDKCRLWGKIQVMGIGTALKVLFSGHEFETSHFDRSHSDVFLRRSEIVALFNVLGRLSSSIQYLQKFEAMEHKHR